MALHGIAWAKPFGLAPRVTNSDDGDIDFNGLRNISKEFLARIREDKRRHAQNMEEELATQDQETAARVLEKLPEVCKKQADIGFYYAHVMSLDCHSVSGKFVAGQGNFVSLLSGYPYPDLEYSDLKRAGKIVFDYLQQQNMSPFISGRSGLGLTGWDIYISWETQEDVVACISGSTDPSRSCHQAWSMVRNCPARDGFLCHECNLFFPKQKWRGFRDAQQIQSLREQRIEAELLGYNILGPFPLEPGLFQQQVETHQHTNTPTV